MANYHLSLSNGRKENGDSARTRRDYIFREHEYSNKKKELVYKESGNLPTWARNSEEFWLAADMYERANARIYKELECSLPNELTFDQQKELMTSFVKFITEKEGFVYSLGMHEGRSKVKDKPNNPHFHLIFNDRVNDGIERTAETHFRRANNKNKNRGGAEKSKIIRSETWMEEVRKTWADLQNSALEKAGLDVKVDHRSLEAQGVDRLPEKHLGVRASAMERRGISTERGDINREREKLNKEINTLYGELKIIENDIMSTNKNKQDSETNRQIKAMGCRRFDIKLSDDLELKDISFTDITKKNDMFIKANDKSNVEIRPSVSENSGLLLVENVNREKLEELHDAGYNATTIVIINKDVYEAWIKVADTIDPESIVEAAKILESEYNVKVSPNKYGKLSGFYNHTSQRSFFVRCGAVVGVLAKNGKKLIEKVKVILLNRNIKEARLARIKYWIHTPYKKLSFIETCIKVYQPLVKKYSDDLPRCDTEFANAMIKKGYKEKPIIDAIIELSPAIPKNKEEYASIILRKNPMIRFILKQRGKVIDE